MENWVNIFPTTICVYNLPRLCTSNVDRYTKKGKKQMIPRINFYWHWLRIWHSASSKYTFPIRIPAAVALASMPMQTKRCTCVLIKKKKKKRRDISMLNGVSLKLVNKFTHLGNKVSSAKHDINMRLAKTWTAIDPIYPTPPLGQDMTQGQFLSRV